eukprot:COSAG02_NODE_453_length_22025_cov_16.179923_7_plen_195_part_00
MIETFIIQAQAVRWHDSVSQLSSVEAPNSPAAARIGPYTHGGLALCRCQMEYAVPMHTRAATTRSTKWILFSTHSRHPIVSPRPPKAATLPPVVPLSLTAGGSASGRRRSTTRRGRRSRRARAACMRAIRDGDPAVRAAPPSLVFTEIYCVLEFCTIPGAHRARTGPYTDRIAVLVRLEYPGVSYPSNPPAAAV